MKRVSPKKDAERHSDPSTSSLTPLRSNFLSESPSRSRSLSPRKRLVKQPLHIRMNLTESQMDKITDAFSAKVTESPIRTHKRSDTMTSRSTPKHRSSHDRSDSLYGPYGSEDDGGDVNSPTFSELMPGRREDRIDDPFVGSFSGRRQKAPPPPIQTGSTRRYPCVPQRAELEHVPDSVSPLSGVQSRFIDSKYVDEDDASMYSQDARYSGQRVPPDYRAHQHNRSQQPELNTATIEAYKHWGEYGSFSPQQERISGSGGPSNRLRRSKSTAEGLRQTYVTDNEPRPAPKQLATAATAGDETPLFSPLQFYFRGPGYPTAKKGEKTLIGDNGWLERTDKLQDVTKKTPQKKTGIIDSIKKIAKDMAELSHNTRQPKQPPKGRPVSQVAISLNAREQSLFYCELEFHLSNALNEYITVQLDKGRLVPDKLKKVADAWHHKGRPKVVGFRYNLETQLELVSLHIDDFRFYGRRQGDPIEIAGLLHAMKVNSRAMSVRTYCQPDSVMAKQLVDAQSLFKLIGVPDAQQVALAEVAQFFKVIVERELDRREQREYEVRQTRNALQGHPDGSWHE